MADKLSYEELETRVREFENAERQKLWADQEMRRHYRFVRLVSEISSEFAGLGCEDIGQAIDRALSSVCAFTEADRAYIFQFNEDTTRMSNTHEWCAPGIIPQMENLRDIPVDEELPWFAGHIRGCDTFHVPDVDAMPAEALLDQRHFKAQNIKSLIAVPMVTKGTVIGFLGFDSVRNRRTWEDDDKSLLRFLGQTLIHVIERKKVEDALHEVNTILNRSPAVAFTWKNQEGWPVEFVTENVEKLFGHSAMEFTSGAVKYADCIHERDLERVFDEVTSFSSQPGTTEFNHQPYRIVDRDGAIKFVSDWTFIERDAHGNISHYKGIIEDITKRKLAEDALRLEKHKLEEALKKVKTLSGMLPICAACKKIRDDKGYWKQIEAYFRSHSEVEFSHGICPECATKLYPELYPASHTP